MKIYKGNTEVFNENKLRQELNEEIKNGTIGEILDSTDVSEETGKKFLKVETDEEGNKSIVQDTPDSIIGLPPINTSYESEDKNIPVVLTRVANNVTIWKKAPLVNITGIGDLDENKRYLGVIFSNTLSYPIATDIGFLDLITKNDYINDGLPYTLIKRNRETWTLSHSPYLTGNFICNKNSYECAISTLQRIGPYTDHYGIDRYKYETEQHAATREGIRRLAQIVLYNKEPIADSVYMFITDGNNKDGWYDAKLLNNFLRVLPELTGNEGKHLVVNADGEAEWQDVPSCIPPVEDGDVNNVLHVDADGNVEWIHHETLLRSLNYIYSGAMGNNLLACAVDSNNKITGVTFANFTHKLTPGYNGNIGPSDDKVKVVLEQINPLYGDNPGNNRANQWTRIPNIPADALPYGIPFADGNAVISWKSLKDIMLVEPSMQVIIPVQAMNKVLAFDNVGNLYKIDIRDYLLPYNNIDPLYNGCKRVLIKDNDNNVVWNNIPDIVTAPNKTLYNYYLGNDNNSNKWVAKRFIVELPTTTGKVGQILRVAAGSGSDRSIMEFVDAPDSLPTGGTEGQILSIDSDGAPIWQDPLTPLFNNINSNPTTYSNILLTVSGTNLYRVTLDKCLGTISHVSGTVKQYSPWFRPLITKYIDDNNNEVVAFTDTPNIPCAASDEVGKYLKCVGYTDNNTPAYAWVDIPTSATGDTSTLSNQLEAANSRIATLESQLNAYTSRIATLESQLNAYTSRIATLESQLNELMSRMNSYHPN